MCKSCIAWCKWYRLNYRNDNCISLQADKTNRSSVAAEEAGEINRLTQKQSDSYIQQGRNKKLSNRGAVVEQGQM